ncbi:MAG: hypothetical protein ACI9JL_003996 [Paracoccaceae bacterium]|jgi:hypothetical protein
MDNITLDFESDNDSLYVMPLSLVPFETTALARGRLRMACGLEHVVDVFNDGSGRSGYLPVDAITQKFGVQNYGWQKGGPEHPDLALLQKLKKLTSFDVYSLRILFRANGISPTEPGALELSDQTKASLSSHLLRFTPPLILSVYGDVSILKDANDPVEIFRNPDRETAIRNLEQLAQKLEIGIDVIPAFLEKFSECFLSISYFERYLHAIYPEILKVNDELETLKGSHSMQSEPTIRATCDLVSEDMTSLIMSTLSKIERFHRETESMWVDLTASRFYEISELVKAYQVSVASVLCGLGVKIQNWRQRFATGDVGGPTARADALMSSLLPGLDRLKEIDALLDGDPSLQIE